MRAAPRDPLQEHLASLDPRQADPIRRHAEELQNIINSYRGASSTKPADGHPPLSLPPLPIPAPLPYSPVTVTMSGTPYDLAPRVGEPAGGQWTRLLLMTPEFGPFPEVLLEGAGAQVAALFYDPAAFNGLRLLKTVRQTLGGRVVESIGILAGGGPGEVHVLQHHHLSARSLAEDDTCHILLKGLADCLHAQGRFDLLTPRVGQGAAGEALARAIHKATNRQVALNDPTAPDTRAYHSTAAALGKEEFNLMLGRRTIPAGALYFSAMHLATWQGRAARGPVLPTPSPASPAPLMPAPALAAPKPAMPPPAPRPAMPPPAPKPANPPSRAASGELKWSASGTLLEDTVADVDEDRYFAPEGLEPSYISGEELHAGTSGGLVEETAGSFPGADLAEPESVLDRLHLQAEQVIDVRPGQPVPIGGAHEGRVYEKGSASHPYDCEEEWGEVQRIVAASDRVTRAQRTGSRFALLAAAYGSVGLGFWAEAARLSEGEKLQRAGCSQGAPPLPARHLTDAMMAGIASLLVTWAVMAVGMVDRIGQQEAYMRRQRSAPPAKWSRVEAAPWTAQYTVAAWACALAGSSGTVHAIVADSKDGFCDGEGGGQAEAVGEGLFLIFAALAGTGQVLLLASAGDLDWHRDPLHVLLAQGFETAGGPQRGLWVLQPYFKTRTGMLAYILAEFGCCMWLLTSLAIVIAAAIPLLQIVVGIAFQDSRCERDLSLWHLVQGSAGLGLVVVETGRLVAHLWLLQNPYCARAAWQTVLCASWGLLSFLSYALSLFFLVCLLWGSFWLGFQDLDCNPTLEESGRLFVMVGYVEVSFALGGAALLHFRIGEPAAQRQRAPTAPHPATLTEDPLLAADPASDPPAPVPAARAEPSSPSFLTDPCVLTEPSFQGHREPPGPPADPQAEQAPCGPSEEAEPEAEHPAHLRESASTYAEAWGAGPMEADSEEGWAYGGIENAADVQAGPMAGALHEAGPVAGAPDGEAAAYRRPEGEVPHLDGSQQLLQSDEAPRDGQEGVQVLPPDTASSIVDGGVNEGGVGDGAAAAVAGELERHSTEVHHAADTRLDIKDPVAMAETVEAHAGAQDTEDNVEMGTVEGSAAGNTNPSDAVPYTEQVSTEEGFNEGQAVGGEVAMAAESEPTAAPALDSRYEIIQVSEGGV